MGGPYKEKAFDPYAELRTCRYSAVTEGGGRGHTGIGSRHTINLHISLCSHILPY